MGFGARLPGTKLTLLARLSATSGAPHRQCLFLGDSHGYTMRVCSAARWSILHSAFKRKLASAESRHSRVAESGAFQAIGCAVADGNVWTQIRSRALNKTVRTGALMEVPAEYPQGSPKAFTFEQTHVVASSPWVLPPTLLGETTVWIQERPSRASDFFPPRSHVGHHCKVAPRRAE
jgi:hypothetical protein